MYTKVILKMQIIDPLEPNSSSEAIQKHLEVSPLPTLKSCSSSHSAFYNASKCTCVESRYFWSLLTLPTGLPQFTRRIGQFYQKVA